MSLSLRKFNARVWGFHKKSMYLGSPRLPSTLHSIRLWETFDSCESPTLEILLLLGASTPKIQRAPYHLCLSSIVSSLVKDPCGTALVPHARAFLWHRDVTHDEQTLVGNPWGLRPFMEFKLHTRGKQPPPSVVHQRELEQKNKRTYIGGAFVAASGRSSIDTRHRTCNHGTCWFHLHINQ